MIFHIASKSEWEKCRDKELYAPNKFAMEGFIHCSTKDQIQTIANARFKAYSNIFLLCIDENKEQDYIRYENLEGGREMFPHIYRKLPKESILQVFHLKKSENENFKLPSEIFSM